MRGALAQPMNGLGDYALTRAALPGDQHGGADVRNLPYYLCHPFHCPAVAKQAFEMSGSHQVSGRRQLTDDRRATAGSVQGELQLTHIQRLLQEINRAMLKDLPCEFFVGVPAIDDNRRSQRM